MVTKDLKTQIYKKRLAVGHHGTHLQSQPSVEYQVQPQPVLPHENPSLKTKTKIKRKGRNAERVAKTKCLTDEKWIYSYTLPRSAATQSIILNFFYFLFCYFLFIHFKE